MVSQREFDQSIDYSLVYRPLYWLLLKIESDDHTQYWCVLVATVSTPIYSVMFTPTMQYTTYHLCEQFVRDYKHLMLHFTTDIVHMQHITMQVGLFVGDTKYL